MLNMMLLLLGLLTAFPDHTPATVDSIPRLPVKLAQAQQSNLKPITEFESMGEVSLFDDRDSVIRKKGKPLSINKDVYSGYTEYQYKDITVGLSEDFVYYVHVDVDASAEGCPGKIQLNGQWLPLQKQEIAQALGEPDLKAEDGDVYIRDLAAVKIYRHPATKAIVGVDMFDTIAF
ncbi:hypothetical protein QNH46_20550 [Paenibacillus woosongensis]|uniref:Uncharacterized protein n=1 Tax=Paenibacillus woosongensis TaxID=307580 RepID=A0AA95I8F1_9BACL|nr:hypothetical protein [Paenibacillus woosongensis]WHX48437.1 hypothetical protein QNH46_20550 [Paenibacillus woosongensis]